MADKKIGDSSWLDPEFWSWEDQRGWAASESIIGEFQAQFEDTSTEDLDKLKDSEHPFFEGEPIGQLVEMEKARRRTLAKFPGIDIDPDDPKPPEYVFHMTPTKNVRSILRKGLVPRSPKRGDTQFTLSGPRSPGIKAVYTARYPEEIVLMALYLYLDDRDEEELLRERGYKRSNIDPEQTILKIRLRPGIRYREDPQFDDGAPIYMLLDRIHPSDIQVVDSIDLRESQ